jgi:hypothetical protein
LIASTQFFSREQVTEQSMEAFILRIHKGRNNPWFGLRQGVLRKLPRLFQIPALPDKVLKVLHAWRLYLYPRFRDSVRKELERRPPAVAEFHQGLSPLAKEIQNAIAAAVQSCIREPRYRPLRIT